VESTPEEKRDAADRKRFIELSRQYPSKSEAEIGAMMLAGGAQ
jgi:hypothetical protein